MTKEEKLKMLEKLTGETDSDTLSTYLFLAEQVVLTRAYPYGGVDEVPAKYDGVHIEIAQYMLNKRGAEGETVHTENGVSRHYEEGDIPPSLLRRIVPTVAVINGGEDHASDEA